MEKLPESRTPEFSSNEAALDRLDLLPGIEGDSEYSKKDEVRASLDDIQLYIEDGNVDIEQVENVFIQIVESLSEISDALERKNFLYGILEKVSDLLRVCRVKNPTQLVELKEYIQSGLNKLLSEIEKQNYLLFLQYKAMREDGSYLRLDEYNKNSPMEIASGLYVANTPSGIKISLPQDAEEIKALNAAVVANTGYVGSFLNAQASQSGTGSIDDLRSNAQFQQGQEKYRQSLEQVKEFFNTRAVPLEHITTKLLPVESNQVAADMQAFSTLTHQVVWTELNELFSFGNLERPEDVFYFLRFANTASKEEILQAQEYTEEYGQRFIRSFLSLAHGGEEVGSCILAIAEKLPKPAAEKIFSAYAAIVEAVDEVAEILQDQPDSTPERIKDVKLHLYAQGVRLLKDYGAAAKECADETCQDIGRELAQRLALAKSSVFAMGAVTRQLVKEDSFDFEKFSQLELVQETPPLSDNFAEQIRTMHQSNTEQYPEKLKEYWRGTLAEALASENPEQKFVYVKMGEDVLAVMRVIDDGEAWYGASFNVNPTIQGSRVGSELLKKVIADMGSQKPFVADVYAENPMLQNYIDTFGFEITKTTEDYHDTGTIVHEITWTEPE